MKEKTQNHGITLTTLIITVIILLILAGVGIGLFGGDGLLQKAKEAREQAEIDNEKEIVETSVVQAVSDNRYGNIELSELQDALNNNNNTKGDVLAKDMLDVILVNFTQSNRNYEVDDEGNVRVASMQLEEAVIMKDFYTKAGLSRDSMEKITFVNSKEAPENVEVYDVSQEQNGTVNLWTLDEDGNDLLEVYIGANYRVIAPNSLEYFFNSLANCVSITGLEYLDTSNVTNFGHMLLYSNKLKVLDDLSTWDTSNATSMFYMFGDAPALEKVDVSNFDTSNVTNMGNMFRACSSLTSLDLSNFDTSKVTDMNTMFAWCKMSTLDISSFDFSNVTNYVNMFNFVKSSTTVYVKDSSAKEWIENNPTTSATIEIKQ